MPRDFGSPRVCLVVFFPSSLSHPSSIEQLLLVGSWSVSKRWLQQRHDSLSSGASRKAFGSFVIALVFIGFSGNMYFRTGDRVRVVGGGLKGSVGQVVDVRSDDTVAVVIKGDVNVDNVLTVEVKCSELSRCFLPGDYVAVISGTYAGVKGFIVALDDSIVDIYVCLSSQVLALANLPQQQVRSSML